MDDVSSGLILPGCQPGFFGGFMPVRSWTVIAITLLLVLFAVPASAVEGPHAPANGRDVVLAGLYSDRWESASDFEALAQASGKRASLMGTFHHLWESENGSEGNTAWLLDQAWSAQATPVANVEVMVRAAEIASGVYDDAITQWALRVKGWLDLGEGRSMLIAPLQEMNSDWVPYGMDPGGFRDAYRRFVEIFRGLGLDETKVRWVFAPNAWSTYPYRTSDYYPGDEFVDFVGISAYNFGSTALAWTDVYGSGLAALDEMRSFAPYKPYLIIQVGSSTTGGDRDAWLRDLFQVATADPNVVGLIYFNFNKETDWKLWDGAALAAGWRDGMQMPTTIHRWPLDGWFEPGPIPFAPYEGAFADDDTLALRADIDWLVDQGIAQGCSVHHYCPSQWVTRAELATFLVRALHLPGTSIDRFVDDNGSPHEADINALAAAGITAGCTSDWFCPGELLSRQQLASLLVEALDLPPSREAHFTDYTDSSHVADIDALVGAGITMGCASDRFCPSDAVSREQLAGFLRRSLDHPPTPPIPTRLGVWQF
jgi:hypothetical protein